MMLHFDLRECCCRVIEEGDGTSENIQVWNRTCDSAIRMRRFGKTEEKRAPLLERQIVADVGGKGRGVTNSPS